MQLCTGGEFLSTTWGILVRDVSFSLVREVSFTLVCEVNFSLVREVTNR